MKRKLLKQIRNEWRSNTWLAIELLVVSVVMWYILDIISVQIRISHEYMGFDYDNCYIVDVQYKTPDSYGYIDYETEEDSYYADYTELKKRLNNLPEVFAVGNGSSFPFNYNFWGQPFNFSIPGIDSLLQSSGRTNRFNVDAGYTKVFRTTGLKGETPEQLSEILADGKAIITANMAKMVEADIDPLDFYNSKMMFSNDSTTMYQVGAVIPAIRRGLFEPAFHATVLLPCHVNSNLLKIRLKEGTEDDFFRRIKEEINSINYGNAYISEVKPISQIRDDLHRNDYARMRNLIICMVFLLITIFLGLLGTFWFRTQQRVHEIAVRKVTGATRPQIFSRLICEGLLILAIVTPIAYIIDLVIQHYDLSQSHQIYPEGAAGFTIGCVLAVAAMIALMIVAGIYFPARKAMNIEPADVLRGE